MTSTNPVPHDKSALDPTRCAATGAVVFGVTFLLCWVGAALGIAAASHMFISLFTGSATDSPGALFAGGVCSVVVGAVLGLLFAVTYNAFGFLARR